MKKFQNNSEDRRKNRPDIYQEFVKWSALPTFARHESGIKTQLEFAARYDVSKDTLSLWKRHQDFRKRVEELRDRWSFERTPDILQAVYRSAVKGSAAAQKLWLNKIDTSLNEGPEKSQSSKESDVVVSVNDVRFIIHGLPKEMRQRHFDNLRDLLIDGTLHTDLSTIEANEELRAFAKEKFPERYENLVDDQNNTPPDVSSGIKT